MASPVRKQMRVELCEGGITLHQEVPSEAASVGDKDHISRLPDSCLLEILQYLKRKDLFNVFLSSKRFGPVTCFHSLDNEKWGDGVLSIIQLENGVGFDFDVTTQEYPWNDDRGFTSFQYTIKWSKEAEEGFIERRAVNGFSLRGFDCHDEQPIPDEFFANIKEILRHHEVKTILIEKLCFDCTFFSKLLLLLTGHRVKRLDLKGVVCENINEQNQKSFIQFVKSLGVIELDMASSPSLNGIIDDRFFVDLSDSSLRNVYTDSRTNIDHTHLLRINHSNLPFLSRYTNLESSFIIVNAHLVITLMINFMRGIGRLDECNSRWLLAIDGVLSDASIAFQLMGTGYKHEKGTLKSDYRRMCATFHVIRRGVGSMIDVKFFFKK